MKEKDKTRFALEQTHRLDKEVNRLEQNVAGLYVENRSLNKQLSRKNKIMVWGGLGMAIITLLYDIIAQEMLLQHNEGLGLGQMFVIGVGLFIAFIGMVR